MDNHDLKNRKKRSCYSVSYKLKVVDFVKRGNSKHKASIEFGVARRRVQEWCGQENELRDIGNKSLQAKRKAGGGRKVRYGEIDETLWTWFQERRAAGVRVTGKALKQESLRLHKANGSQSFKASTGWFRRFKKRRGITFRRATHISQQPKEVTDERVDKFLKFVLRMRRVRNYPDRCIGNMDETPVWLEMPGTSTLESVGRYKYFYLLFMLLLLYMYM